MLTDAMAVDDAAYILAEIRAKHLRIAVARRDCLESPSKPFSRIDLFAAIVVGIQDIRAGRVDQLLRRNKHVGPDNVAPRPVQRCKCFTLGVMRIDVLPGLAGIGFAEPDQRTAHKVRPVLEAAERPELVETEPAGDDERARFDCGPVPTRTGY